MTKLAALTLGLLMIAPVAASANVIEDRRTEQAGMIERGRQDGSITWTEGLKLRKQQREIARVEQQLSADGRLTRDDRRVIRKLQNQAEDTITNKATNRWHRAWFLPRFGR